MILKRGGKMANKKPYARLGSITFWKAYWITMRPYLLFVSAVAGMAGFADGPQTEIGVTALVFIVFFLSYGFSQGVTDSFQMDTDAISSPYRPLIQGIINRAQVLPVSLVGLFAGCAVLFILNPKTIFLGLPAVLGLITYTYFKRRWWAGPFYNAWIVAFLPIIGKMVSSGRESSPSSVFQEGMLLAVVLSVFFSYANFVLMGYYKDISADRKSGYNTFLVVFGWQKGAVVCDIFAGLSLLASGWGIFGVILAEKVFSFRWVSLVVFAGAAALFVLAQVRIHKIRDEELAFKPIANVVRGFILLHLAEIFCLRPEWIPAGVLFYISFEWILKRRPAKEQV